MIKYCKDKWDLNKYKFYDSLEKLVNSKNYSTEIEYEYLIKAIIKNILTDYDDEHIIIIDNGEYQGTLLFVIPLDTYQPDECEHLLSFINYGSYSGCDALQRITFDYNDNKKNSNFITDLLNLCKDIVNNTIKPYNYGWREDPKYYVIDGI